MSECAKLPVTFKIKSSKPEIFRQHFSVGYQNQSNYLVAVFRTLFSPHMSCFTAMKLAMLTILLFVGRQAWCPQKKYSEFADLDGK